MHRRQVTSCEEQRRAHLHTHLTTCAHEIPCPGAIINLHLCPKVSYTIDTSSSDAAEPSVSIKRPSKSMDSSENPVHIQRHRRWGCVSQTLKCIQGMPTATYLGELVMLYSGTLGVSHISGDMHSRRVLISGRSDNDESHREACGPLFGLKELLVSGRRSRASSPPQSVSIEGLSGLWVSGPKGRLRSKSFRRD